MVAGFNTPVDDRIERLTLDTHTDTVYSSKSNNTRLLPGISPESLYKTTGGPYGGSSGLEM